MNYFSNGALDFTDSRSFHPYTAFILDGFDDQERNLMFVKTGFQVLKLKFLAYNMKQAFYLLHNQKIARAYQQENTFKQAFRSVSGCQTCMCKRGISDAPPPSGSVTCYVTAMMTVNSCR